MRIRTIFFDLDDTLYPKDSGVWDALRGRIAQYMHEVVGIPEAEVPAVREFYLKTYGTSLRGLQKHHGVDAEDYLRYTHELPIEQLLAPNPALDSMLGKLPQAKYIFTNSASYHAERVLKTLGAFTALAGSEERNPAADVSLPQVELLIEVLPALVELAHG